MYQFVLGNVECALRGNHGRGVLGVWLPGRGRAGLGRWVWTPRRRNGGSRCCVGCAVQHLLSPHSRSPALALRLFTTPVSGANATDPSTLDPYRTFVLLSVVRNGDGAGTCALVVPPLCKSMAERLSAATFSSPAAALYALIRRSCACCCLC